MARPNRGKTKEYNKYPRIRIHPDLLRLLESRRKFLINDGQKFANKVSDIDIEKEFVEHYWRLASGTIIGRRMRKFFDRRMP